MMPTERKKPTPAAQRLRDELMKAAQVAGLLPRMNEPYVRDELARKFADMPTSYALKDLFQEVKTFPKSQFDSLNRIVKQALPQIVPALARSITLETQPTRTCLVFSCAFREWKPFWLEIRADDEKLQRVLQLNESQILNLQEKINAYIVLTVKRAMDSLPEGRDMFQTLRDGDVPDEEVMNILYQGMPDTWFKELVAMTAAGGEVVTDSVLVEQCLKPRRPVIVGLSFD